MHNSVGITAIAKAKPHDLCRFQALVSSCEVCCCPCVECSLSSSTIINADILSYYLYFRVFNLLLIVISLEIIITELKHTEPNCFTFPSVCYIIVLYIIQYWKMSLLLVEQLHKASCKKISDLKKRNALLEAHSKSCQKEANSYRELAKQISLRLAKLTEIARWED